MHNDPETWHALLSALTDITITFLQVQIEAGVDAVQLFDSWAGALSLADYRTFVHDRIVTPLGMRTFGLGHAPDSVAPGPTGGACAPSGEPPQRGARPRGLTGTVGVQVADGASSTRVPCVCRAAAASGPTGHRGGPVGVRRGS